MLNVNINMSQHRVNLLFNLNEMVSGLIYKCWRDSKRVKTERRMVTLKLTQEEKQILMLFSPQL